MAIPGVNTVNKGFAAQQNSTGGINDVDIDDFLKLMITELQNQDPLNPMENEQLINQIGQIRQVGASEKLTSTLDSVLLGQNVKRATNLIGAEIDAISDDNQKVTGVVEKVSVANGEPKLHLDLNPHAALSDEDGDLEKGDYEYRVVWTQDGTLFGVDPAASTDAQLQVGKNGSAVQLSNLPVTQVAKHVYRREVGEEDFHLVGSISDGKSSTFLDGVSNNDLSDMVLGGTPQMLAPSRSFTVSLKNVGEIRPPAKASAPITPTTPTDSGEDDTTNPERAAYRPTSRPTLPLSTPVPADPAAAFRPTSRPALPASSTST